MSTSGEHQPQFLDHVVVEENGDVIGTITDVVFDPHTGEARYAVVKPGRLHKAHYLPLDGAYHTVDGAVATPHRKSTVMHAPTATADHVLSEATERQLQDHYS